MSLVNDIKDTSIEKSLKPPLFKSFLDLSDVQAKQDNCSRDFLTQINLLLSYYSNEKVPYYKVLSKFSKSLKLENDQTETDDLEFRKTFLSQLESDF